MKDHLYIGCSLCRLIRRPDHLIGRHWYLPENWISLIWYHLSSEPVSVTPSSVIETSIVLCSVSLWLVWINVQTACALNTQYKNNSHTIVSIFGFIWKYWHCSDGPNYEFMVTYKLRIFYSQAWHPFYCADIMLRVLWAYSKQWLFQQCYTNGNGIPFLFEELHCVMQTLDGFRPF
jgi:hypothetical protein